MAPNENVEKADRFVAFKCLSEQRLRYRPRNLVRIVNSRPLQKCYETFKRKQASIFCADKSTRTRQTKKR